MKKIFKITAAVLAAGAAITLAGCSGCAGCNRSVKNSALTNSNWYTGTSYKGIQPSFIQGSENAEYTKEVIEYTVTHDKATATNNSYSVEYKDGSFVTEFYAFKYDWKDNKEYPEDKTEILYRYETELNISVRYALKAEGSQPSEWFTDKVKTISYFRAAGKNLQPVYSRQEIVSHSPAALQAATLENAYDSINVTYENYYNFDCTAVTSVKGEEKKVHGGFDKINSSLFDNSSLYIAVRSLKLSESLSQTIYLFSAVAEGTSSYALTGSNAALDESEEKTELKAISEEMKKHGLFIPSENRDTIPAVAVNIGYAGGDLHGTTQTAWFAAIENPDNNTGRATMLKLSVPLPYSQGTLNYSLKEIKSTLWNG